MRMQKLMFISSKIILEGENGMTKVSIIEAPKRQTQRPSGKVSLYLRRKRKNITIPSENILLNELKKLASFEKCQS